jgi:Geranylgeranyl pyrophosphate synthase
MDDYLDYAGSCEELGKNIGDDLADGKCTLPVIKALTECSAADRAVLSQAIEQGDHTQFAKVSRIVSDSTGLRYTKERAQQSVREAIAAITVLPESEYRDGMITLAELAIARAN